MLFAIADPDQRQAPTEWLSWAMGRSVIDVTDGSPDDGDPLTLLSDTSPAAADATQTTVANRPIWRTATFPGRGAAEVTAARHLQATPPKDLTWVLVVWDGGLRGVLARDTSATTNLPAFSLSVTEDFG
jgi:hypothetical protein